MNRPHRSTSRETGYALVLALGAMMVVTVFVAFVEKALTNSLEASEYAVARIQADYACYGAAVRGMLQPPAPLERYEYLGTRVQVSEVPPPVTLLEEILAHPDTNTPPAWSGEESIRMLCAVAAAPTKTTSAEATWYYVVKGTEKPTIWAAWPGYQRRSSVIRRSE